MNHKKETVVLTINNLTSSYSVNFLEDLYQLLVYRQKGYAQSLMDDAGKPKHMPLKCLLNIELYQYYGMLKDQMFKQKSAWHKQQDDELEEFLGL